MLEQASSSPLQALVGHLGKVMEYHKAILCSFFPNESEEPIKLPPWYKEGIKSPSPAYCPHQTGEDWELLVT